jgi:ankyrin repeat protein
MSINQRLLASGDLSYFEQVFVNEGIDINGNVVGSNTPLGFACFLENERSVKWLLEHGANPSILPANGVPPLQVAAARGLVSIVKMLLNAGADVSQVTCAESGWLASCRIA